MISNVKITIILIACINTVKYVISEECGGYGLMTGVTISEGGFPVPLCTEPQCNVDHYSKKLRNEMANCQVGQSSCEYGSTLIDIFPSEDGKSLMLLCCDFNFDHLVLSTINFTLHAGQTFLGDVKETNQKFGIVSNIRPKEKDDTAFQITTTIIKCPEGTRTMTSESQASSPENHQKLDLVQESAPHTSELQLWQAFAPIPPTNATQSASDFSDPQLARYQVKKPLTKFRKPVGKPGGGKNDKQAVRKPVKISRSQPIYDYEYQYDRGAAYDRGAEVVEQEAEPLYSTGDHYRHHDSGPIYLPTQKLNIHRIPVPIPIPRPKPIVIPYGRGPACFSAETLVHTENGDIRMDDLKVGMSVMSHQDSVVFWDKVVGFLHRDPDKTALFYRICTESGHCLSLTGKHIVYAAECSTNNTGVTLQTVHMHAEELMVAKHCLVVKRAEHGIGFLSPITSIDHQVKTGIYGPLTAHEDIITNNVFVSCHSTLKNVQLMTSLLGFNRWMEQTWHTIFGCHPAAAGHYANIVQVPWALDFLLNIAEKLVVSSI